MFEATCNMITLIYSNVFPPLKSIYGNIQLFYLHNHFRNWWTKITNKMKAFWGAIARKFKCVKEGKKCKYGYQMCCGSNLYCNPLLTKSSKTVRFHTQFWKKKIQFILFHIAWKPRPYHRSNTMTLSHNRRVSN